MTDELAELILWLNAAALAEQIIQAAADALTQAAELSGQAPDWHAVARVAVDAVTPQIEQRLLERLVAVYAVNGSIASLDTARKLLYWEYNLDEIDALLAEASGEPPADVYERLWLELVTPRIEADLLERVAAIYEAEAAVRDKALHLRPLSYSATAVAERLRYWRDNLNELAAMRQDGGVDG